MEYKEFTNQLNNANNLLTSGRLKEAQASLYQLLILDISDLDKASLCIKMAYVYDRLGETEEALSWYEKGIGYEQLYFRYEVLEKKGEYLTQIGRAKEAITIYEGLLKQPYLIETEKDRIRRIIQSLLGRIMQEWH